MYLFKCDKCGYLQGPGDRFFSLNEITGIGDRDKTVNVELCNQCVLSLIEALHRNSNKETENVD